MAKNITGHIREKKGLYYAVINYYTVDNERKQKWYPTKLTVRGNKKKAEMFLRQVLNDFEKSSETHLDMSGNKNSELPAKDNKRRTIIDDNKDNSSNAYKNKELQDIPKAEISNMLFSDYLLKYVPLTKNRKKVIENTTYSGYLDNIKYPIGPYFEEKGIKLCEITAEDIQEFYNVQLSRKKANGEYIKPNTVIHYHAIIRLALCHARKMEYIDRNPMDNVIKPTKNPFVGSFYSVEELNELIKVTKGTKLELPVIFGGFYGLRRSEIVGLRWSAIDFDNNVLYINHKVTVPRVNGRKKIDAKDGAKTKSSVRALPLTESLKDRLIELKEEQKVYQKKFKRSYSKEWLDYIMVDELGGLILPDYITCAFKHILEKNNLRQIRFHDLRHTCASLLLNKGKQKGVDLKDIQAWLGHSDFATTANIYSHLDAASKTNSLSTLEGVVQL
ncbi:MAG: site-specific integrase [Firmicutes bacterium]|nr:site-specific integrase [Bacillota bacterium]